MPSPFEAFPETVVALCVPVYETVQFDAFCEMLDFCTRFRDLAGPSWRLVLVPCRAQPVHVTRSTIAEAVLDCGKVDILLWVDSDIAVPAEGLIQLCMGLLELRLLRANPGIVAAPCVLQESSGVLRSNVWALPDMVTPADELFKATWVGFGCLAMDAAVLRSMKDAGDTPYFRWVYEGKDKHVGEDGDFCARMQKYGFTVWVDPRVETKHVFRRAFSMRSSAANDEAAAHSGG